MASCRPADHLRPINGLHTERTALEPYWCQGYERGGSLRRSRTPVRRPLVWPLFSCDPHHFGHRALREPGTASSPRRDPTDSVDAL